MKTDDLDGQALENVAFDLVRIDSTTDENGEESATETVISKHATNAAGKIVVENLPTGHYKFVESRPLEWYEDNTDDLSFTVTPKRRRHCDRVGAVNYRKPFEITTKFATTKRWSETSESDIDNDLTDYVSVDGMKPGHTYYVDTTYSNRDTKKSFLLHRLRSPLIKKERSNLQPTCLFKRHTERRYTSTATHIIYEDKEKRKRLVVMMT